MTRKTVSRKKPAHKTKRRSRGRGRARGSRRTRVKRGGMMGARAAAARAAREAAARAAIHSPILTGFQQAKNEAIKEVKDPVKTVEKGKALYDKAQEALDEERKTQEKKNRMKLRGSLASTFSQQHSVLPFSLQSPNVIRTEETKGHDITSVIAPRFSTPNSKVYPQYSSQVATSQNPPPRSELNRHENDEDDEDDEDYDYVNNTAKVLF